MIYIIFTNKLFHYLKGKSDNYEKNYVVRSMGRNSKRFFESW